MGQYPCFPRTGPRQYKYRPIRLENCLFLLFIKCIVYTHLSSQSAAMAYHCNYPFQVCTFYYYTEFFPFSKQLNFISQNICMLIQH